MQLPTISAFRALLNGLAVVATLTVIQKEAQAQEHNRDEAADFIHLKAHNGVEFDYVVLEPKGFDSNASYATLLAFPPAEMDRQAVEWSIDSLWSPRTENWLIVIPTAPRRGWRTHPSHHALNAMLDQVKEHYKVEGGKFHMTGYAAEGSRTAVTYANMSREYFLSLTVASGSGWSRWSDSDLDSWGRNNKHMPVTILVGEFDKDGIKEGQRVTDAFLEDGIDVEMKVVKGFGEGLESMLAGKMIAEIEENAGL